MNPKMRMRGIQSSSDQKKASLKQSFKVCFCFRRMFKVKMVEPPEEVKHVFNKYSNNNGTMSIDDLHRFLVEFQGEKDATKDDALEIFNSLRHLNIFQRRGLHIEAFFRYLMSNQNDPIISRPGLVHQDMTAPLAHYFLYTGHNSYLTGNQFSSDSSTVPIIEALKKGVRVIELDLWPNSKGDDAQVRHGGTLTAPVELRECLEAIKDHAFEVSEYPLVITFEDHLNSRLQAKVGKMVKDVFGEMLYLPESQHQEQFPSPQSLKRKVMISTKPPEYPDAKELATYDDEEEEYDENAILGYRNLIAIHAGKPKGDKHNWFDHQASAAHQVRRLSLSEQELEDVSQTHATHIVRFTQKNLLRIYPKGTRLDSSNYDPLVGWTHGAQMVAFNMQGHGKFLRIMEGMFRGNGGCGYVKKPDILLRVGPNDDVFDPSAPSLPIKQTLQVIVYMGEGWHSDFSRTHFDLYSPPDFFVKVGICGVAADTTSMKRTKAIEDQWNPVWNEEFRFPLRVPELALLRIETLEYDTSGKHDFGGQTCLPVSELKTGMRAVPLYSRKGQRYPSVRLLIAFHFLSHQYDYQPL